MNPSDDPKPATFPQTRWTLVVSAGREDDTDSERALQSLCQDYWYPLYCYTRRRGSSASDAEDLTQGFFEHLLVQKELAGAAPEKGRFRSFLLTAFKHYITDEWRRSQAKKRGGRHTIVSFDQLEAEERFQAEPLDHETPESLFEQAWAKTLLASILKKLGEEQRAAGKEEIFEVIRPFVEWSMAIDSDYSKAAKSLDMTANAVRVMVFRTRQRYTELLRNEIAETVATPEEAASEMDHLFSVLRGDAA